MRDPHDPGQGPFPKYEATITVRMRFESTTDSIAVAYQIASNLVRVDESIEHEIIHAEVKKVP